MRKIIIFILLILLQTTSVIAQEGTLTRFWLNAGAGLSTMQAGFNINANVSFDNIVATLRHCENAELFGDRISETGLLLGYINSTDQSHLSISGGIAEGTYKKSSGMFSPVSKSSFFGFAAELQYCYLIWDFLGIGVTAYGNFNKSKNVFGANINLFIGSLGIN
jgi:hypothetical protein